MGRIWCLSRVCSRCAVRVSEVSEPLNVFPAGPVCTVRRAQGGCRFVRLCLAVAMSCIRGATRLQHTHVFSFSPSCLRRKHRPHASILRRQFVPFSSLVMPFSLVFGSACRRVCFPLRFCLHPDQLASPWFVVSVRLFCSAPLRCCPFAMEGRRGAKSLISWSQPRQTLADAILLLKAGVWKQLKRRSWCGSQPSGP